ncbi:MAG: aspartate--tRNA ligase [Elusimicrobia bacterium]|nr:aspartate--tRNA ligase [Elusimicrobiota bacterium]
MKRTHYCGAVKVSDIGTTVNVCGWVHARRDHGGVVFIDLRDREGIVQVVFHPENKDIFSVAEKLRSEFVVEIVGIVRQRPAGTENPHMLTGQVEVVSDAITIINSAPGLPFEISDFSDVSEDIRLKYRYLDLRKPKIMKHFLVRHKLLQATRKHLDAQGFIEVETPMLGKTTPEGAREFIVPSRLNEGHFFALPQSPQIYKQILMVAGFDKYFQIVRCFRDEDLRADRQPEFTQIDLELSFVDEQDVMKATEEMVATLLKEVFERDVVTPFPRLSYAEAMLRYGSDKPDTRFALEIVDLSADVASCGFKVFAEAVAKGGVVRGLRVPAGGVFSRSEIDGLTAFVGQYGARGLAWMKVTDKGLESNIVKFFSPAELSVIQTKMVAGVGDLLLFLADTPKVAAEGLGALRMKIARQLNLIDATKFNFLWVVDFPLVEWDADEKRWNAMHHPFTSPKTEDLALLNDPSSPAAGNIRARAYDIVLNGVELGGGSIRIHQQDIQKKMFAFLNIGEVESQEKFGYLLEALSFGAPPHGGIALGFDRFCALLMGEESIREVIAFPKTQKAACPLTNAPGVVSERQLKELGIKLKETAQPQ